MATPVIAVMSRTVVRPPAPRVKGAKLGPGDPVPNAPRNYRERAERAECVSGTDRAYPVGWLVGRSVGLWLVSCGWGVQIVCGRVFDVRLESL